MISTTDLGGSWSEVQEIDANTYVDLDDYERLAPKEGEIDLAGDGQGTFLAVWQSKDCLGKALGEIWADSPLLWPSIFFIADQPIMD